MGTQTGVFQSVAETTGLKKRCEECRGRIHGRGRGAGEEVRVLQGRRYAEHEAEEQASNEGTQGRQPIHQGAVRFQGEACLEDGEVLRDEEAQGDALKWCGLRVMSLLAVGNGQ